MEPDIIFFRNLFIAVSGITGMIYFLYIWPNRKKKAHRVLVPPPRKNGKERFEITPKQDLINYMHLFMDDSEKEDFSSEEKRFHFLEKKFPAIMYAYSHQCPSTKCIDDDMRKSLIKKAAETYQSKQVVDTSVSTS